MATFITSKLIGETIQIFVNTSTGFWKYNHNGSDSSVFSNGWQTITVANADGEFTLISCNSDGTVNGDITYLELGENQLTTFNTNGLTSLTDLNLGANQLTSFNGTGLSSLTGLNLGTNQLTSVDVTGLSSLISLDLGANQLTSVDVTGLSSLTNFSLNDNLLTPLANNQVLHQLSQNGVMAFGGKGDPIGWFSSNNGRTAASNADYDNLFNNLGWRFQGLDLVSGPVVGNGKLRVKGVTTGI